MKSQKLLYCIIAFLSTSCGDLFTMNKHLVGDYYLVESEGLKGYGVYLKLQNGDFIGRVSKRITNYCVLGDTIIVAGVSNSSDSLAYYIIDITKDHDFAENVDVVTGPVSKSYLDDRFKGLSQIDFINPGTKK